MKPQIHQYIASLLSVFVLCGLLAFTFTQKKKSTLVSTVNHENKLLLANSPYIVEYTGKNLKISLKNAFDVLVYKITDEKGRETRLNGHWDKNTLKINLDHLPDGQYLVKLYSASQTYTANLIHKS